MIAPEFSRPLRVDTVGAGPRAIAITANTEECAALARRFDLIAVERLDASLSAQRDGDAILVSGQVTACVVQRCVATGAAIPTDIDEAVALRFVAETATPAADEIELAADALDVIAYAGDAIDLGEAAAETMALALDPFPRSADAAEALKAAGVVSEDAAGPFGALAALRDRLGD